MRAPHRVVVDGETRQVYAKDRMAPAGARFVYLPDGEAARFRIGCKGGALICPVPGCPDPRYRAVGGEIRRHHFRHVVAPKVAHAPESFHHLCAKDVMAAWLADNGAEVTLEDRSTLAFRPDILAAFPGGQRLAVEIQYASIGLAQWRARHRRYERQGLPVIWLFGHMAPYVNWRSVGLGGQPSTVASTGFLAAAEAEGIELRWIDPENQLIISATRADQERVGYRVRSTEIAVARHQLADCTIEDGVFSTPSDARERETRAATALLPPPPPLPQRLPIETPARPSSTFDSSVTDGLIAKREYQRRQTAAKLRERSTRRWVEIRPQLIVDLGAVPGVIEQRLPTDEDIPADHAYWHWSFCAKILGPGAGTVVPLRDAAEFFPSEAIPDRGAAYRAVIGFLVALRETGYVDFPWSPGRGPVPIRVVRSPLDR